MNKPGRLIIEGVEWDVFGLKSTFQINMKSMKNEINVIENDCFVNIRVDGLNNNSLYLD